MKKILGAIILIICSLSGCMNLNKTNESDISNNEIEKTVDLSTESNQIGKTENNSIVESNDEKIENRYDENKDKLSVEKENDILETNHEETKSDEEMEPGQNENENDEVKEQIEYTLTRSFVGKKITIKTIDLSVYSECSTESMVLDSVTMGDTFYFGKVSCDADGNIWYKIRTENDISGWIISYSVFDPNIATYDDSFQTAISLNDRINEYVNQDIESVVIIASVLNVRSESNENSEVIDKVSEFSQYPIHGEEIDKYGHKWFKIITENEIEGWVAARYCVDSQDYIKNLHSGYYGEIDDHSVKLFMTEDEVEESIGRASWRDGVGGVLEVRYGDTAYYYQYSNTDKEAYGKVTYIRHTGKENMFGLNNGMTIDEVYQVIGKPHYDSLEDRPNILPGPYSRVDQRLCYILNDNLLIITYDEKTGIVNAIAFGTKYYSNYLVG